MTISSFPITRPLPGTSHNWHHLSRSFFVLRRPFAPLILTASLAGILLPVPSALASAQQTRYQIDPAHSSVRFALGDTLHRFGGLFQIASADIAFDPSSRQMSGKIVVDAASGDSGSHARDKRMTKDELQAQSFPSIIFEPQRFSGDLSPSGSSQIQVSGTFTLLGQPHPITVPMRIQIDGDHCTATGQFDVPYIDWGLRDPSMLMVRMQKQVRIDLTLTGHITSP